MPRAQTITRLASMFAVLAIGTGCAAGTGAQSASPSSTPSAMVSPGVGQSAGVAPSRSPSASPSRSPSAAPSPSPSTVVLDETHTSTAHGLSVDYPAGWVVARRATKPWDGSFVFQMSEFADVIEDGSSSDTAFLAISSRDLEGLPGNAWAEQYLAGKPEEDCGPRTVEPITVDGAPGVLAAHCPDGYFEAFAWAGGRGYILLFYRVPDKDLFERILATVTFTAAPR